jgi:hypothetical protein
MALWTARQDQSFCGTWSLPPLPEGQARSLTQELFDSHSDCFAPSSLAPRGEWIGSGPAGESGDRPLPKPARWSTNGSFRSVPVCLLELIAACEVNGYRICASAGDASRADLRGPRWRTPRALSCEPLPLAFAPADPLALLTRGSAIRAQPTARKAIPTERLTSPAALGGQDTLQKPATRTTTRTWSQEAFRQT